MEQRRVLSHYELIEKIGQGGMGEVWRARDARLEREVAVKLLPESCTADPARVARFEREAQLASQLSHPNIATIYEAGEDDGSHFIAMELVRGETLAERVRPGGLSPAAVLDLASAMAAGLAEAHGAGIVHRDLKPGNVMIDERGRVKILDFGLSRPQSDPGQVSDLTRTGQIVGTPHYMSPEQIRGEGIDGRSDLFTLGVILYELATGVKPFKGASAPTAMSAVLEQDPPPLMRVNPHVGEPFAKLIERLLAKDPARRPGSADEVVTELARIRSGASRGAALRRRAALVGALAVVLVAAAALLYSSPWAAADTVRNKLVVLPFASFGPPEGEVLAAAISEEIRSRLEVIPELAVMYRTSSAAYRDAPRTLDQIGDELGVDFVLDGNVYLNQGEGGDEVHVQPKLTRVADGLVLWQNRFERDLDDVLAVQGEIARRVVEELGLEFLFDADDERGPPTKNLDAYRAYQRAMTFADSFDPHVPTNMKVAVDLYGKATRLDPEFALAWAELSWSHSSLHWWGHDRSDERLVLAKAAVDQAMALDPDLPEAQLALARWHQARLEYAQALAQYELVRRRRPNSVRTMVEIATIWGRQGRFDDAAVLFEQAEDLSPRDAFIIHEIGEVYLAPRKFEQAERFYDRSISLAPDLTFAYACKAHSYWMQGRKEDAEDVLADMPARGDPVNWLYQSRSKMLAGDYEAALRVLDDAPDLFIGTVECSPRALYEAEIHELMGREDEARAAYERALVVLAAELERLPEDDRLQASLASAYAGLERDEEAVAAARRAVDLVPISLDAHLGAIRREDLAATLVAVGRLDEAVDEIEYLLSVPSFLTPELLEIGPRWRDVRDHPRLREVVAQYRQVP